MTLDNVILQFMDPPIEVMPHSRGIEAGSIFIAPVTMSLTRWRRQRGFCSI